MTANLVGPEVGSLAPDIVMAGLDGRTGHGEVRVVAFAQDGSFGDEPAAAIQALRAQLRGLGAELVVLSPNGVWSLRADDDVELIAVDAVEVAAVAAQRYGVPAGGDAVFVIDGNGIVRFSHRLARSLTHVAGTLAEALAVATEAVHGQEPPRAKERLLFTRREWNVTCLVVGFATAYLTSCKPAALAPDQRPARGQPRRDAAGQGQTALD